MVRLSALVFWISAFLLWLPKWSDSVEAQRVEAQSPVLALEPRPAWVDDVSLDLEKPVSVVDEQSREGFIYRLIDIQKNAETSETFFRYADEFLTVAGVHEGAEIGIEYDPAYETLHVHHVTIHRAGKRIDVTKTALIRDVRPEDKFDSGMLYGHRKLLIVPAGIRVGDVLEYAYTVGGANPYYQGRFFGEVKMNWETRLLKSRYRLVKSPDRPLFTKNHRTDVKPQKRSFGELEEWIWTAENTPAVQIEKNTPTWFNPFSYVELGEFNNWADVAKLGSSHYRFPNETTSVDLKKAVAKIRETHPSEVAQVTAAIRFVQDEIRYVGIEEGGRAYIPVSANVTFARQFGDCKDKTVLLHAMLRELGVESSPVYVDIDEGPIINERLPSPFAFDHVVLRAVLKSGKVVFCDCTETHVGGVAGESIPFPDYHFGLVLFDEDAKLQKLPASELSANRSESVTEIFLGEIKEAAKMSVRTVFTGKGANTNRYYSESDSAVATQLDFLNYYREDYGEMTSLKPPLITDDRDVNRLTFRELYQVKNPWEADSEEPGWYSSSIHLREIRDRLAQPRHTFRETPFVFPHSKSVHQKYRIHLTDPEEWEFEDELHFIESSAFTFRREVKYNKKTGILSIRADFKSLSDHVLPADIAAHAEAVDSAYELTFYPLWNFDAAATEGSYEISDNSEAFAFIGVGVIGGVTGLLVGFGLAVVIWLIVRACRQ